MTKKETFEPLLKLNLQHFAEDGGEGNDAGNDSTPNGEGTNTTSTGGNGQDADQKNNKKDNDKFIPKTRFDEINSKYKELQEKVQKWEQEKEQAELEAQKKRGEFEELYNKTHNELENTKQSYETANQRVQELEGFISSMVEAKLETIPEDFHELIPENMTPEQKLSWLTNAEKKGLFGTAGNSKENEGLGDSTNAQQQQTVDISKMSVSELFRSAYGNK